MKMILTAAAFATLLASPVFAKSVDIEFGASDVPVFNYPTTTPLSGLYDMAPSIRRSNLNPRDPAYMGGGSVGDNDNLFNY